jgi:CheY-specific phosphatase CheX
LALQKALADSIEEILDAMFFTACGGAPEAARMELAAEVAFEGSAAGRLTVRVAVAAARPIAANFLGEEEDAITERQVSEVVCELANMICGSLLSRVEGAGEFRLGTPRMLEPDGLGGPRGGIVHAVETGRGALEAVLEMEEAICPP